MADRRQLTSRVYVRVIGCVQGVGFRPHVYRIAKELGLCGYVRNTMSGVEIELEGDEVAIQTFLRRVVEERPPNSVIYNVESVWLDPVGYRDFEIRSSGTDGTLEVSVLPDLATCEECLRELFDEKDRRFRYPFINCTHCGPRFSILERLPYDRPNTSMKKFRMCSLCESEYHDPLDRRFHAQPIACPTCGPQVRLLDSGGREVANGQGAILGAAKALRDGQIVAVKGLGGFHLMVCAGNDEAVRRLRIRKRRDAKPLAVMFPNYESVTRVCEVNEAERQALLSVAAPIVLLRRERDGAPSISDEVAPGNPYLGVMLPYTPLHHLLLRELDEPVVATSGNISEEPICIDESEAIVRLNGVADLFLVHDRPIVRHVDDSVLRVVKGREVLLRRARGYAPLSVPIHLGSKGTPVHILACGAHQKSTIAVSDARNIYLSQHIGDLETELAIETFRRVVEDLCELYQIRPEVVVCDLHPEYYSSVYAEELAGRRGIRLLRVQHHLAHAMGCLQENEAMLPVLVVVWDGTGYGPDGRIWGGEFMVVEPNWTVRRVATFYPFRLIGGEAAIKEPRRVAYSLAWECAKVLGTGSPELASWTDELPHNQIKVWDRMLCQGVNSPLCTSVGRLFDGVSALLGICDSNTYEGQAAMMLEYAAKPESNALPYEFGIREVESVHYLDVIGDGSIVPVRASRILEVDWRPVIAAILQDLARKVPVGVISYKFHSGLISAIRSVAERLGMSRVALVGGCFQNRLLLELGIDRLTEAGFGVYHSQRVPPNDGGIAFGQVVAALRCIG